MANERVALVERSYRHEYLYFFEDTVDSVFAYDDIQAALSHELRPLL